MVSTVISKIISMQPNFTVSENVISQYVIGHAEQILTTTITALADETGTSEASINRFCKKLGYKGFNGLKIALAQESFYNNMVQETPSSGGNFIASVTSDYRSMLNNTAALLDESTVFKAGLPAAGTRHAGGRRKIIPSLQGGRKSQGGFVPGE